MNGSSGHMVRQITTPIPTPTFTLDGDEWCALYGEDLVAGVAGFGATLIEALVNFEREWSWLCATYADHLAWMCPNVAGPVIEAWAALPHDDKAAPPFEPTEALDVIRRSAVAAADVVVEEGALRGRPQECDVHGLRDPGAGVQAAGAEDDLQRVAGGVVPDAGDGG